MPSLSSGLPSEKPSKPSSTRGLALVAGGLVGLCEDDVRGRDAGVGDEQLLAVEDVVVALLLGGGLHGHHVAAGVRFGEAVGAELLAL